MSGTGHTAPIGPGTELDGFVLEAVAGRGGMGVVYRARQHRPDRIVAVKVISTELAGDPAFRARFQRESSIAAQIEHPNVIPVHTVGEADGVLFIAMRFVDGVDLRTLLAQAGRLEPRRAAAIIDQVAQALDAAHAHGLVHRDVKPANVLIATAGGREHVYLTDFGLARHVEGSQGLTGTGAFLGTIDFVAPEQARGQRVDARTDVYSLGCALFQALTGTVPYPLDNDLAKLYAHDTQPPPSALERDPSLPRAFEQVLARAMAKAPEQRYLSAGDLGRAAVAAASGVVLTRAERSVAIGGAAPLTAEPVAQPAATWVAREAETSQAVAAATAPAGANASADTRPRAAANASADTTPRAAPTTPARGQPPAPDRPQRRMLFAGALAVIVLAAIAGLIAALSGGGSSTPAGTTTSSAAKQPATIGIVLGQSIGPSRLGEPRPALTANLVRLGYVAKPGHGAQETDFTSAHDQIVVGFENGTATYIQKYNDAGITVKGVSVNSTLRTARARLPDWRTVRCPPTTDLIAPDGHTYFELPLQPDATNDGSNGIIVTASPLPADRSACN